MPQVKFEKQISLSPEETFKKVIALMDKAHELKKLDPDLKLTVQHNNLCVLAEGSKINGSIRVTNVANTSNEDTSKSAFSKTDSDAEHISALDSVIHIDLNIPWSYAPFKSIIKSKLEEKIEEMC